MPDINIKLIHIIHLAVLVGKPEGRRPFGKPRRRLEDKIKFVLKEIGREGVGWVLQLWFILDIGMNHSVSSKSGDLLSS
jgi:hypothetical protein